MKNIRWPIAALVVTALILFIVFICSPILRLLSFTPEYSPADFEAELERNRAKWDNADIAHYRMVVDFSGYGSYRQMPWTLEVQDDKAIYATGAQGNLVPIDDAARFTVAALFVRIGEAYQDRSPSIRISYDPTYGYPEDISINPYVEPCCQGYDIEIRDFQLLPQYAVSPTPHTPRMICTKYPGIEVYEMVAKSDSLWVAGWSSVHRLDTQSLKTQETIEFPDLFIHPRLLMITDHGVWADGLVEWIYYDGKQWTAFELNRGVAIDEITPPIYQSQDGRYWFSSRGFLLLYDPAQKSAQGYVQDPFDQDGTNRFVIAEYNGDLFGARIAPDTNTAAVFPLGWSIVFDQQLAIQQLKEMPFMSPAEYADMAVGPDGSIWIADAGHVSRFNPTTEQWVDYDARDNVDLLDDLAVAPDGSVWLTDGHYVVRLIPLSATTNEAQWEHYDARDGFEDGSVQQISIGIDGTIWIGTADRDKPLNQCKLLPNHR